MKLSVLKLHLLGIQSSLLLASSFAFSFTHPVLAQNPCVQTNNGNVVCGTLVPSNGGRTTPRQNFNRSITGKWSGKMTQNRDPMLWNFQLNILQRNKKVVGRSSKQPLTGSQGQFFVSHDIEGELSSNTLDFREVRIRLNETSPGGSLCNIQGQLKRYYENGSDVLKGPWECFHQGERYYGEITLYKESSTN